VSITNVRVFNGHTADVWPVFSFDTSTGKIISPQNSADNTIDGNGCTLIPGLIDAKIDAGAAPWAFPKFAAAGITTVIDTSSETADTNAMRRAACQTPGWPSYFASGSAAGSVGMTQSKELSIFPHRGIEPVSSPAEAKYFLSKQIEGSEESGLIRVIIDAPGLDDDTLRALVNGAHRHGKLVVAHASQVNSYRRAISVGCEIINLVPDDNQLDSGIIDELREKGIAVVPSLSLIRCVSAHHRYPSSAYENAVANVRALSSAGVSICAGTSANDIKGLSISFTDGIYEELVLLAQAGLSNFEALRAATSVPAQALRLLDRGALKVGKRSDLTLLRGNPFTDLSAIRHVERVWTNGVEFDKHVQGVNGVWTAEQCGKI
jgi:imidazolonepropionase-like amidohydrolase